MSEIAPINDVPESNGGPDQPIYNGETEEHTSMINFCFNLMLMHYLIDYMFNI